MGAVRGWMAPWLCGCGHHLWGHCLGCGWQLRWRCRAHQLKVVFAVVSPWWLRRCGLVRGDCFLAPYPLVVGVRGWGATGAWWPELVAVRPGLVRGRLGGGGGASVGVTSSHRHAAVRSAAGFLAYCLYSLGLRRWAADLLGGVGGGPGKLPSLGGFGVLTRPADTEVESTRPPPPVLC